MRPRRAVGDSPTTDIAVPTHDELGSTSHHPRWAFAYKFEPRQEQTRVLRILASVGRTGIVTPVAVLRPVEVGGVTVKGSERTPRWPG
jgi:NAD-dependent DNA ligase